MKAGGGFAFVGHSTATAPTGATVTCDVPVGVQDGDFLIAILSNNQGGTGYVGQPLTGWTRVDYSSPGPAFTLYHKIAASEPSDYTFTMNFSVTKRVVILAFRGISSIGTIGIPAKSLSASSSTASAITVTDGAALLGLFHYGANNNSVSVSTPPSDMETLIEVGAGAGMHFYSAIQYPTATGSTGTKGISWGGTGAVWSVLMELLP